VLPDLANLAQIERVLGFLENLEALGVGLHHPVLDAVVDHFDEVAGPVRAEMPVAVFGRQGLDGWFDARERLGRVATVVDGGQPVDLHRLTEDLYARGVNRLMVEGGGTMHTQFLTADLADELHLVVAPFFVGDSRARRFVGDGRFPWNADRRATLAEVRQIGDVVLLRYALSDRFETG